MEAGDVPKCGCKDPADIDVGNGRRSVEFLGDVAARD